MTIRGIRSIRVAALAAMAAVVWAGSAQALDVPLKVVESGGVARATEPCHSGVPLPAGAVSDLGKLCLLDAAGEPVAAQFRALSTRQSGDVAWLAVSFLADVPAGGSAAYRLTDSGKSPTVPAPLKVADAADAVTVVTGPLKVVLPKAALAGVGEVWLDRDGDGAFADGEKVAAGGALVVEGMDGRTYRSDKDMTGPLQVSLEEAGPIRAVVRIDGQVKVQSADGGSHTYPNRELGRDRKVGLRPDVVLQNADASLGFTVRLYFWKGQSRVRCLATVRSLRGKSSTQTDMRIRYGDYYADAVRKGGNVLVDGISFELGLPAPAPATYRIGGGVEGDRTHEGRLADADDGVTLYQESSAGWLWQAGSENIFDPRLRKNKEFMDSQGNDKAYSEYDPLWYDELNQQRDGLKIMGYRLYPTTKPLKGGPATSSADLGDASGEGVRAPGWLELDDGKSVVTIGCRWFWQLCPKDIQVSPGRIRIGLWSQLADRGHLFEGTIHKTHELMFDFAPSGKGPSAAQRFAAFGQPLLATTDARHVLASGQFGDFMLPNEEQWPRFERSALTSVVCGVDPSLQPGLDSSFEIEREKYDHYGVWRFGDHSKGGYHQFSQYLELDVPYCLMIHFARTGDMRFYREAEVACRQLLDVPAHGGGYGHQKGEASHFYTTGPLLYAFTTGEQWLLDAVLNSYKVANTRPWHLRSFGVTMWSSLDIYTHFHLARQLARGRIDVCLDWWKGAQDKTTGRLGGFDRGWQTFFFGLGTDAMGRYCEAFPEDKQARDNLVSACREWVNWFPSLQGDARRKAISPTPANGLAYATRFSGDQSLVDFATKQLVSDAIFRSNFRSGTTSGKEWSEHGHRLVQVYLHDVDAKNHPDRYKGLP